MNLLWVKLEWWAHTEFDIAKSSQTASDYDYDAFALDS